MNLSKNRIVSLSILEESDINLFFTLYTIDSSFHCLQLLILKNITSIRLVSLLKDLNILPHLISLVIDIIDDSEHLTDIYQLIFCLPMLKYLKLSLPADEQYDLLPLSNNSTSNCLECLYLDYPCTFEELTAIVSYTPRLKRLTCVSLYEYELDIEDKSLIKLPNLINLNIQECYTSFENFERFLKQISSQLQRFHINIYENDINSNCNRWKQLIVQYFPRLDKFNLSCIEHNIDSCSITNDDTLCDDFISLLLG